MNANGDVVGQTAGGDVATNPRPSAPARNEVQGEVACGWQLPTRPLSAQAGSLSPAKRGVKMEARKCGRGVQENRLAL